MVTPSLFWSDGARFSGLHKALDLPAAPRTGDRVVVAIGRLGVLPAAGADQAERIQIAIMGHPGAVGVAEQMKSALAFRKG